MRSPSNSSNSHFLTLLNRLWIEVVLLPQLSVTSLEFLICPILGVGTSSKVSYNSGRKTYYIIICSLKNWKHSKDTIPAVVKAIHFLEAACCRQFGRSLIYLRKSNWPKTEPWGTPRLICFLVENGSWPCPSGFDCLNTTQTTLKSGFPFESTMSYM